MAPMPYLVLTAALLGALAVPQVLAQAPRAPFVATPPDVVDRMLALANVGPRDVVYDLGCGDGRIVIAAAQKFGARGVGIDIDPARIYDAEQNAKRAGVERLVTFKLQDALKTDVSDGTEIGRAACRERPQSPAAAATIWKQSP